MLWCKCIWQINILMQGTYFYISKIHPSKKTGDTSTSDNNRWRKEVEKRGMSKEFSQLRTIYYMNFFMGNERISCVCMCVYVVPKVYESFHGPWAWKSHLPSRLNSVKIRIISSPTFYIGIRLLQHFKINLTIKKWSLE